MVESRKITRCLTHIDDIVEVSFLDHKMGTDIDAPSACAVWGRLVRVESDCIVVTHWQTYDGDIQDANENTVIVRSTITGMRTLR